MIAIIDYGMGNLRSVQKAFEKVGAQAKVTQDPKDIKAADKVVLPGVGAMQPAMEKLNSLGLVPVIQETIATGKPFLGICLGLQLLFEKSSEGGNVKGMGVLKGSVERFNKLKVPHMGWNQIAVKNNSPLFEGIKEGADFYFCHSYYVKPEDKTILAGQTDYGTDFASAISKDKLFGVQFHPEKSQTSGLKVLENFTRL